MAQTITSVESFHIIEKVGLPEVDKVMEDHRCHNLNAVLKRKTLVPLPPNDAKKDGISKLPDDVLHFILSFLTMREGGATGILSRRWRNLWRESASRLDFTDVDIFGYQFTQNLMRVKEKELLKKKHSHCRFRMNPTLKLCNLKPPIQKNRFNRRSFILSNSKWKGALEIQTSRFIRRVNRILKFKRVSKITKFQVSFPMEKESTSHINRWMKLAAAQGVEKLNLDFSWPHEYCSSYISCQYYEFPIQQFGSSLTHLRLKFCSIENPLHFQGLQSLVSLSLSTCFLTNHNVQTILTNCPLQFLSLAYCSALKSIPLKFVGPSTLLKHLDISECDGITDIELQDLNILSFELRVPNYLSLGWREPPIKSKLSIKNCQLLTRLVFHTKSMAPEQTTLSNVPRLEILFSNFKVSRNLLELTAFNNLKRLVFSGNDDNSNLFEVLPLIEACPLLQQLHVEMDICPVWDDDLPEQNLKVATTPKCLHYNLKEVEIYGFDGHPEQIELAKYLLKHAMVLERMKIFTTNKSHVTRSMWTYSKRIPQLLRMSLDKVRALLLKEKSVSTKLFIVSQ